MTGWSLQAEVSSPAQVAVKDTARFIRADMLFGIDDIIAHVSEYFTLNIGDLIFTGTPAGVGECVTDDLFEGYLEGQKVMEIYVK